MAAGADDGLSLLVPPADVGDVSQKNTPPVFVDELGGADVVQIFELVQRADKVACFVLVDAAPGEVHIACRERRRHGRHVHAGKRQAILVDMDLNLALETAFDLDRLDSFEGLGGRGLQPIELVATYLGAHTLPPEYRSDRSAYVDLVMSDELMGRVAEEGLAEFCDVFCEEAAFTLEESRRVLEKGKDYGLAPKIHADQITQMGASRLAAEVGAVTAEHLEHIDDSGAKALRDAKVIAGLLPGCSFYLGVPQAPARRILREGIPIAIATDYNPGSSMVESLPLVLSIACTQLKLSPSEALIGATLNAAAALRRDSRIGLVAKGMEADLVVLDTPSVDRWLYQVGRNAVQTVLKKGRVVYEKPSAKAMKP